MVVGKPAEANFLRYRGRSMWPIFQDGDLLEVEPVEWQELRVGDCITYHSGDDKTLITHRIIAVRARFHTHPRGFTSET